MTRASAIRALTSLSTRQLYLLQYLQKVYEDKPKLKNEWADVVLLMIEDAGAVAAALTQQEANGGNDVDRG